MASENYGPAAVNDAVILAAKLRYLYSLTEFLGVFGEAGGWVAPSGTYDFARSYANGSGTATGSGSTSGWQGYVFGRLGLVWIPTKADEVAPAVEIGRQNLVTNSYSETLSAANPFEARITGGSATMEVVRVRAQWSHGFTDKIDATVWGAFAEGFNAQDSTTAQVDGVGVLTPRTGSSMSWGEYGVRLGYRISNAFSAAVFVNGVAGAFGQSYAHAGGALLVRF